MCCFITLILPSPTNIGVLAVIANKYGRTLEPLANRSVVRYLKRGEVYFFTTAGMCDCGTTLGCAVQQQSVGSGAMYAQLKKLRMKGWSESKINRWIESKFHHQEKQKENQCIEANNEHRNWFAFTTELLDSKLVTYVSLLLHNYSGSLSSRICVRRREHVFLQEQKANFFTKIQEDVIYEFH